MQVDIIPGMNETTRIEDVKDYYDQNVIGKLKGFVYGNKRVERAWQEMNNWIPKPPENILEIGCGIGDISWRFSQKFPQADILGFDVSNKSIEIANKLFHSAHLTFVQADDISMVKTNAVSFDLIFLMDVFEHIPVELRTNLFEFTRNHLAKDGIVFMSCPAIAHQNHLRKNNPSGLQPVDEDISIKEMIEFSEECHLPLLFFKEISVWNTGDYLHAVFGSRTCHPFSDSNASTTISLKKLLYERAFQTQEKNRVKELNAKLDLIKSRLGADIYKQVIPKK